MVETQKIDAVDKPEEEAAENAFLRSNHTKKERFKNFLKTKKGKITTSIIALILIFILLIAIPFTRYGIFGLVIRKEVQIIVLDSVTNKPVVDAKVSLGDKMATTSTNGEAKFSTIPVGKYDLKISKQYYKSSSRGYTVPVLSEPPKIDSAIIATGRQVEIKVIDKITQNPIKDVVLSVNDTTAATNSKGMANIVLPAGKKEFKGSIAKKGYNTITVNLIANPTTQTKNEFSLTVAGSIYYLSKATGVINVMKANIDGSEAKVIVTGTGQENDNSTVLLSARDWKYSALVARRETDKERLYLVDSAKDDLSVIDEGNATFRLVGWSGHNFIYVVERTVGNVWENKAQVLKSFNAETRKITVLDETVGTGTSMYDYQYQLIGQVYILDGEVVYPKSWNFSYNYNFQPTNRNIEIVSLNPSSASKKIVKEFPQPFNTYIDAKLYEPQGVYLRLLKPDSTKAEYYEYENKALKAVSNASDDKFYGFYATFLVSPSGNRTFWYEPRDGKNTIFTGDNKGKNGTQIAELSEYTPYGWYGDDDSYVLFSKNGSELYIAPAGRIIGKNGYQPIKVTDYHKPRVSYPGYGYGYGGQ